jgi:RNA polymerase sigma-70 factor (ECF subfamily)
MELLERFARGDVEAFETLFRQLHGDVYGWILRIVRDPGIAEDLTVETFWRMYRARARFDPKQSIGAWARRIATNAALDYLRTRRPETELPADLPQAPSPDAALQREMREQIRRAFDRLPTKLRVAAVLALVEERPYEEIADALGTSVGAVKLRVFRAVRRLRKQLDQLGVHP